MAHNSLSMYLQSTILHHFTVAVNNIEITVNTCTCTDVFTVMTTKDQSGGIYSTGGAWPGIYGCSKQTSSSGYALRLSLFTAINPWHLCYNYNVAGR